MTTFLAGQVPTAAELTAATAVGVIRRGRRASSTATTTGELAVLRVDGIPVTAGRTYRIWTNSVAAISTVAGDNAGVRFRVSTTGAATTASTILDTGVGYSAGASTAASIIAKYTPAATGSLSLLLSVLRIAGTGACSIVVNSGNPEIEIFVEDMAVDPGDSGVVL